MPWGWRVSLYTWTKSAAAGSFLVAIVLALAGKIAWTSSMLAVATPAIAAGFLILTGILLISDLKRPGRFYLLFTHPQSGSWLVRGGFILAAFGGLLVLYLLAALTHRTLADEVLGVIGLPVAVATAVYTAYLFAASSRDLWQSPLLGPHLVVQAVFVGTGILLPTAALIAPFLLHDLALVAALAAGVHLLFVAGEVCLPHPGAQAHLALLEMVRGRLARTFWTGAGLGAVALFATFAGWWAGLAGALGVLLYEHAYVQAGQAVPLA
jgi:Ni/Fe-hydrogenase subunit HybB-like protein